MPHSPFFPVRAGIARFSPYLVWLDILLLWVLAIIVVLKFTGM